MLAIRYAVLANSIMLKYFHFSAGDFPYCSHSDPLVCSKSRRECEPPKTTLRHVINVSGTGQYHTVPVCSLAGCWCSLLATRIGTDPLTFVTKEAEKDLQKGFVLKKYSEHIHRLFQKFSVNGR